MKAEREDSSRSLFANPWQLHFFRRNAFGRSELSWSGSFPIFPVVPGYGGVQRGQIRDKFFQASTNDRSRRSRSPLKKALRAEIDEAEWSKLYSATSQPFDPPNSGKIAVKVINHYGDEVLKVFPVGKTIRT